MFPVGQWEQVGGKPGRSMGLGRVLWAVPPFPAVVTAIGCTGVSRALGDTSMSSSLSPGVAAASQELLGDPCQLELR